MTCGTCSLCKFHHALYKFFWWWNFNENNFTNRECWVVSSFTAEVFYFLFISGLSTGIKFIFYTSKLIFVTTRKFYLALMGDWQDNESGCKNMCKCTKTAKLPNLLFYGFTPWNGQNLLFCGFTPWNGRSVWFHMHHKCHGDKCS